MLAANKPDIVLSSSDCPLRRSVDWLVAIIAQSAIQNQDVMLARHLLHGFNGKGILA
jgi:hypothetical protein